MGDGEENEGSDAGDEDEDEDEEDDEMGIDDEVISTIYMFIRCVVFVVKTIEY